MEGLCEGSNEPPGSLKAIYLAAPDSLSSLRSPALDEATLAGSAKPAAGGDCETCGEVDGGGGSCGGCRGFTAMLKSSGIGADTDTSIATLLQPLTRDKIPSAATFTLQQEQTPTRTSYSTCNYRVLATKYTQESHSGSLLGEGGSGGEAVGNPTHSGCQSGPQTNPYIHVLKPYAHTDIKSRILY
ncbi:hypothetical protein ANN_00914 [Periplaneta americana]|uniref:Uncharacterized protein n=1 Tax=Periplaneta americana TaxID=6978 RepID=A0ABQ8TS38_PERAM|nr:hypothetical protein ANN_00914 [Periplaneta americana]